MKRHDSLTNVLTDLQLLIGKVETAPLPTSFHALAASPALLGDSRVIALLDSLREIEKDRENYGTGGEADPLFLALTARMTDIGRAIGTIASVRRDSLQASILRMTAPRGATPTLEALPDTMQWLAERDSAVSEARTATTDLAAGRRQVATNAEEVKRAQEISVISASPFAMIVAAAVFGVVLGFGFALAGEIRHPTVASGGEVERGSGARIVATVGPVSESTIDERRQANRIAPRYLDFNGDSYRLAYLHIEQSVATPNVIAILGADPDVSAIVAMNLASIAVDEARSVLVVDATADSEAIRSLLPALSATDVAEVFDGRRSWNEAIAQMPVGRDKMIHIVTGNRPVEAQSVIRRLGQDKASLGERYDAVLLIAPLDFAAELAVDESLDGVMITATVGETSVQGLLQAIEVLRGGARPVFGVVLWDGPAPRLAARARRRGGGQRKQGSPLITVPFADEVNVKSGVV